MNAHAGVYVDTSEAYVCESYVHVCVHVCLCVCVCVCVCVTLQAHTPEGTDYVSHLMTLLLPTQRTLSAPTAQSMLVAVLGTFVSCSTRIHELEKKAEQVPAGSASAGPYVCPFCSISFDSERGLKHHRRSTGHHW